MAVTALPRGQPPARCYSAGGMGVGDARLASAFWDTPGTSTERPCVPVMIPPRGRTGDQRRPSFRWLRGIGSDTFALRHHSSAAVEPWYSVPPKMPARKAAGEVAGATT